LSGYSFEEHCRWQKIPNNSKNYWQIPENFLQKIGKFGREIARKAQKLWNLEENNVFWPEGGVPFVYAFLDFP